jgi:hypothetical protein
MLKDKAWLGDTRYVSAEEQLAVFLRITRTGQSNREMQERFQRSGDTISKYVILSYSRVLLSYNSTKVLQVYLKYACFTRRL